MSNPTHGSSQLDDYIGQILADRYEIVSFIGRGAMGSVYKARQIAIGRDVAIKMMLTQSSDERATQRFVKEAMAMSALNHPHLISIIDFGETPEGNPFLVMEYLEGTTLTKLIDKAGLPVMTSLKIVEQIAEGLAHAHARGFIHRDLKPSNVMLIGDNRDFVKIVDLGIVKALEKEGSEAMRLTHTGEIFGSPLYMSPEQCLGQGLDERSDIYALGCLTYETITGQPPIIGENFVQTVYRHVHEIPNLMCDARPDLNIPPEVESLVARALAKNRDDRHSSMRLLKDDIAAARSICTAASGAIPFVAPSAVIGKGTQSGTRVSQSMAATNPPAPSGPVRPFVSSGGHMTDTGQSASMSAILNRPGLVMAGVGGVAALLVFAGIGISAMFSNFGGRAAAPAPPPATAVASVAPAADFCPTPEKTAKGQDVWPEPLIQINLPRTATQKKVVVLATDGADPGSQEDEQAGATGQDVLVDPAENGDILVDVKNTVGPFTLVLASHEKLQWHIEGDTAAIQGVKVLGFKDQTVVGVPEKLVVHSNKDKPGEVHFFTVRLPDAFYTNWKNELKNFENDSIFLMIKDAALKAAGSPMTNFQGQRLGKKFTIQ